MSSHILQRIDQKLSFILSSLVGKNEITESDVEKIKAEKDILLEKNNTNEDLLNKINTEIDEIADELIIETVCSKIAMLIKLEDEEKNTEDNLVEFDDLDIDYLLHNQKEVITFFNENFSDIATTERVNETIKEILK